MANRWLFKTEPGVYSFQQLEKDTRTVWDGVKNSLALRNLAKVKKDDLVMIYHTGEEKSVVGIAQAASDGYPDPANKASGLMVVDLKPLKPLEQSVSLKDIKANPQFATFDLVRLPRLSVMPVTELEWKMIESMSQGKAEKLR